MLKRNDKKKNTFQDEVFTDEEFLLVHTTSQEAFMNLSKKNKAFSKKELLNEIKRLVREQVREQLREKVSV